MDKYCELMVASHQQDCLWRKRGCDGMSPTNSMWCSFLTTSSRCFAAPLLFEFHGNPRLAETTI